MSLPSPAPLAGPPRARRFPALWVAAVFAATATASEPPPFWRTNLSHKAWTKQDGAPSAAMAMVQDRAGMLWLGASDGLFRFDGVRFERLDDIAGNKLLSPNVRRPRCARIRT